MRAKLWSMLPLCLFVACGGDATDATPDADVAGDLGDSREDTPDAVDALADQADQADLADLADLADAPEVPPDAAPLDLPDDLASDGGDTRPDVGSDALDAWDVDTRAQVELRLVSPAAGDSEEELTMDVEVVVDDATDPGARLRLELRAGGALIAAADGVAVGATQRFRDATLRRSGRASAPVPFSVHALLDGVEVGSVRSQVFVGDTESGLARLRTASTRPPEVFFEDGQPIMVDASVPARGASAEARARSYLERHQDLYAIPDLDDLIASDVVETRDDRGVDEASVRFTQYTPEGLEVLGSSLRVAMRGGNVVWTHGRWLVEAPLVPAELLSWQRAQVVASSVFPGTAEGYPGLPSLVYYDPWVASSTEDQLSPSDPRAEVAWRVRVGGTLHGGADETIDVIVGAESGEVRSWYGMTQHNAPQEVWDFELEQISWRCGRFPSPAALGHPLVCDGFDCARGIAASLSAIRLNLFAVSEYFEREFGWSSYDNQGGLLLSAGRLAPNPPWAGFRNGACNYFGFHGNLSSIALIGHEFGHGVTGASADLVYRDASGAVNEAFSQIFGALAKGLLGQPMCDLLCERGRVVEPNHLSDYCDEPECGVTDDTGGVHRNRYILQYPFELMMLGGAHPAGSPEIDGMGSERLEDLVFATLTQDLTPYSGLIETCNALRARAQRWAADGAYGFDHDAYCAVAESCAASGLLGWVGDCARYEPTVLPPLLVPLQAPEADDADRDGIPDDLDNCPRDFWPSVADADGDGIGDFCDDDIDGDLVSNANDLCPLFPNDSGDRPLPCGDPDGDGIPNALDLCPFHAALGDSANEFVPPDIDGDGIGNECDDDPDGDGVPFPEDLCPRDGRAETSDRDGDGTGDLCDFCPDDERWSICVGLRCDGDADGVHDNCDPDRDGDGVENDSDNCPTVYNPDQTDLDGDGHGFACDTMELWDREGVTVTMAFGPGTEAAFIPLSLCTDDCDELRGQTPIELAVTTEEAVRLAVLDNLGAVVAWFQAQGEANGLHYFSATIDPPDNLLSPDRMQAAIDAGAFEPFWASEVYYLAVYPLTVLETEAEATVYVEHGGTGPICGNGCADLGEVCDGPDLRGVEPTCAAIAYPGGGTVTCNAACDGFETVACERCTSQSQCFDLNESYCLADGRCDFCGLDDDCAEPYLCEAGGECRLN